MCVCVCVFTVSVPHSTEYEINSELLALAHSMMMKHLPSIIPSRVAILTHSYSVTGAFHNKQTIHMQYNLNVCVKCVLTVEFLLPVDCYSFQSGCHGNFVMY